MRRQLLRSTSWRAALIDSLALVTLLFELEREFDVRVPLETLDVEDFRTLASIAHRSPGPASLRERRVAVTEIRPLHARRPRRSPTSTGSSTTPIGASQRPSFRRGLTGSCSDPWADPEIPTLVHVGDSGEITGFIGSHVRRLRLDGLPIRLAAGGPLIVHPQARSRAVGARLWRRYLAGPQDLTTTDGASDEMRQSSSSSADRSASEQHGLGPSLPPFSFVASRALHPPRDPGSKRWARGICWTRLDNLSSSSRSISRDLGSTREDY